MDFICDDKYQNVIDELESRGWKRFVASNERIVPSSCGLIWKNLSKTSFSSVLGRYVNHIQGIHHLSNKSYLVYHLRNSVDSASCLPLTWSSSFQSISLLIGTLVAYMLREAVSNLLIIANNEKFSGEPSINIFVVTVKHCYLLQQALQESSDTDWKTSHLKLCFDDLLRDSKRMLRVVLSGENSLNKTNIAANCRSSLNVLNGELGSKHFHVDDKCLWIIKPVALSCGQGITIVRGTKRVLDVAQSMNFKCVVQKYIEAPLLVRNKQKFDIRQWVLLTSANPLVLYGFSECYLRLSSKPFNLEDEYLTEPFVHLCNQSVQKSYDGSLSANYGNNSFESDTMMSQVEFDEFLGCLNQEEFSNKFPNRFENLIESKKQFRYERDILPQIRRICIEATCSARDRLKRSGKGFEWLGVDLMVTEDLHVKLIEVNVSPDTTPSTPITKRLVAAATQDLFNVVLDENIVVDENLIRSNQPNFKHCEERTRSFCGHSSEINLHWNCWFVGPFESAADIKKISDAKIKKLGILRIDNNRALPNDRLLSKAFEILSDCAVDGVGEMWDTDGDDEDEFDEI